MQVLLIFYSEQWFTGWKIKCDGDLFSLAVWNISIAIQDGDYVLNGCFINARLENIADLQHPQQMSHICNFHNTSTPPFPLFSDPLCFPFPSAQHPNSRLTVGAPSSWPIILYPHVAQTITLEANSPLFPSSAVLSLIFNKKDLVSSITKLCLEPSSYILTPPYIVCVIAQCWSTMNQEVLLLLYITNYQPSYVGVFQIAQLNKTQRK